LSRDNSERVPKLELEYLAIRLDDEEKEAFTDAAKVASVPLSIWVRERLGRKVIDGLDSADHPIAFSGGVRG